SELDLNLGDFSFDRVDASAGSGFGEEDGSVSLLDVDSSADPFASASPEADSDFANFLGGGLESPDEVSAEELFNPFETEGAIATPIESSMADLLEGVENPSDTSDSEGLDLDFFGADASAVENSASGSTAEDVGVDPFTEMTSGGSLDEDAGFGLFGDAEPNLESSSDAAVLDLFADEAPPDGEAEFDLFTETATTADEEAGLEFAETPGTSTNAELDLFAETEPEVTEDAGLDLFAEPEVTADTELDLFAETESGTTEEAGLGLFSETEPETNEDSGFDPFADAESASNAEVGSELFANSELESGDDAGFDLFADTEPASAAETGLDLFANTESAATEEAGLELFAESESRSTESASNDDGFDLFTQTESASEAFDGDAGFDLFAEEAIAPPPSTPEPLAETVSDTDLELDLFAETEPALPMSGAEESFADDFAMELPAAEAEGLMFDTNETLGVGEFPELATDPALSAAADPLGLGEVADSEPIGLDELGIPGLEEIGSDSSSFELETAPESVLMPLSEDASEQLEDWIEAAEVSAEEVPAESDDPFGFDAESENPLDLMAMSEAELTPLSEEASEQLEDWIEAKGSPELDDPFGFDAAEEVGAGTEAAIALDNFNFADSDLMAEGDSDLLGLDAAIAPSHSLEEVTAPLTESSPKAQLPVVEQTLELDGFSGFSDLEAMLTEASASGEAALEMPSDSAFSGLDDFADLESMLGEESPAPVSAAPQSSGLAETGGDFDDLEALLGDAPPIPAAAPAPPPVRPANDEFGDLEDMLKDADQTLGGGAVSGNRKAAAAPNRRSNRRGAMTDQTMRVSVKHLDNLNNLVGEMVVNRNSLEQAQERLRQFLDNLLYQVQQLSDVGQRMRDLYERSLLESSLLSTRRSYHLTPNSGFGSSNSANNSSSNGSSNSNANGQSEESQGNHATGASFDALEMDRFTGFHTLSQEMIELIVRVRESASDIDFVVEESDQVTRNFRQITTQLQEGLTKARMVPFAQTADRLPRGVRDNALKYGKQAELVVEGRDTLIDKMIVEQLYDPMTHLVNNAIAHGIETPAERIAAGKPPLGQIVMRTFHQGNQTIISVSDDGAGIDPERVKSKAIDKGLITAAEAKEMSRMDTYDLLFHHGFSTADQIDDLKGRGVGLDVVRSNLTEIRGVISIDSAIAKGTTFTIRLPLTLSISKALCCISNRARIAFPMDGVEDMLDVPKERVQTNAQGQPCIQWRDALLPFQPLSELLRHGRMLGRGSVYGGNQEEDIISVVVLRSAGKVLALQVDQVLGEQEIVIKQLEGPVPKPVGIAGATVLGDGRIMPIADVLELIDLSEGRVRREVGNSLWVEDQLPPEPPDAKTEPTVLIVDDSITVRELLSMTFNKVGYRVEQARDGQEAWEKLRSGLPCDLVFCDIEMPRMDGLELLSRIQKDSALNHLPIAMLTSRGADRHRQMAIQLGAKGYFTKPYLEEALLDAAQRMLKGEVLVASSSNA
nr:response regulator [Oculatellaceae cyanobacterium Prado106]